MALLPVPFGNPYTYPNHSGVDFPQGRGTIFRASGPGYVSGKGYGPRPGYTVWVKYDNGPNVGYVHMDSPTTLVSQFDRVDEGTPLGRVGSLGQFSTGPHLHSEIQGAASTAGYWRFFDRNRVVGQGSGAGGGSVTPIPTPGDDDELISAEAKKYFDDNFNYIIGRMLRVEGQAYSWAQAAHSELTDPNRGVQMKLDGIAARNDASNTMLTKVLSSEYTDALAAAIVAKLPTGSGGSISAEDVARATRDLFRTEPLG